jgi:hypothetical protein
MPSVWRTDLPQFRKILPLPVLPAPKLEAPAVVRFFDYVRSSLESDVNSSEFCWFAREYPRCFRYHIEHAELRLRQISHTYSCLHARYTDLLAHADTRLAMEFTSHSTITAKKVYWNFEAYLNAVNSALDILARCVGVAYHEHVPGTLNRLCARKDLCGPADVLRRAQVRWVQEMKDFRDCFAHYTAPETVVGISLVRYSDGWQVRAKIPTNPNVRDILGFRYSRRMELLQYSIRVWKRIKALDNLLAKELARLHRTGEFPKRTHNLLSRPAQPQPLVDR